MAGDAMNQIVPIVSEGATAVARAERDALVSLALTQRRLSWRYRNWALEDEARGNLIAYRKNAAEARRLWRDARQHIEIARNKP
jgi:hypothetical protein